MSRFWRHFISNGGDSRSHKGRGFLGFHGADRKIHCGLCQRLQLPTRSGIHVLQVIPESPACHAGLQPNDIIVQLDEQPVADIDDLLEVLIVLPIEMPVTVFFLRNDRLFQRFIVPEEYPV